MSADTAGSQYESQVSGLLFDLLLDVAARHQPEIVPVLRGEVEGVGLTPRLLARSLQAQGIWFHLLSIAEQNAGMRLRRETENRLGYTHVRGTFAQLIADAAAAGIPAERIRTVLAELHIRPVITAHPTEAKRVTVLERHRRIYRRLMDLESLRWTRRERGELIQQLRCELELLWLTGELRLEKPTIAQEVAWGLHFFNETLFDAVPALIDKLESALAHAYPGERFEVRPFFQFGAWMGGDRDGNPFVTNETMRLTLAANRSASLQRYRARVAGLLRELAIAASAVPVPPVLRDALTLALEQSGDAEGIATRNPGELFRQFFACMLARLEATLAATGTAEPR